MAVYESRDAGGDHDLSRSRDGGFFKTSHDKVNEMELLICYIFSQLSISSTKNTRRKIVEVILLNFRSNLGYKDKLEDI